MKLYIPFLIIILLSCKKENTKQNIFTSITTSITQENLINPDGKTLKTRFNPPKGYKRDSLQAHTFGYFLQNYPLKKHGKKVQLFNGNLKNRQDVHAAIFDISVGKRDLQQCADATMRLRADYLYEQKKYDSIRFNFTNGFDAKYSKWRNGQRISVKGNKVSWYNGGEKSDSRSNFDKYLTMVFSYAGTLSLAKEMQKVNLKDLQVGDVFIQGGSPGHAVIVVDIAKNEEGNKMFLLAQSYMPAQEIHILKNFNDTNISPWYNADGLEQLRTPEWNFTKNDLRTW
ncbi:DUF4846 domain-containing protein [Aureibaculum sp. 2210JD6-5]|uniref:DUF4846 domain-containing protein n=1 Tax=Aureibaculum sp. 2210JD6-5 TaxID=3103957 RepID=UPI002AAD82D2|nr:DUF4846 domain-containing protein [Aureibaculum sp. 2210JD6-5]MDY7396518.1 DUF4846 domain-containing protein [Aureibaculum sp. 2210JD6-5]